MQFLLNHLGYQYRDRKILVVQGDPVQDTPILLCRVSGERVAEYPYPALEQTDQWHTGPAGVVDFSSENKKGDYFFRYGESRSRVFQIGETSPRFKVAGAILNYTRKQRCTGETDLFDRAVPFFGDRRNEKVDVHGGWYDASGDQSKYLSHLSYTNFMNPQQSPLLCWAALDAAESLPQELTEKARTEALYGADFLMRMQDQEGYFYQIVFDRWSKDLSLRNICDYSTQEGCKSERWEAGFRQGGGMAIAALARASTLGMSRDYKSEEYLKAAEKGFLHLQKKNTAYLDNCRENLLDDYCALLAAAELYGATGKKEYRDEAERRSRHIVELQNRKGKQPGWFYVDSDRYRPFFHASDEALPVISLLRSSELLKESLSRREQQKCIQRAMDYYLEIPLQEKNPFAYPRQMLRSPGGELHSGFFFPHQNESGYWWQGENARLGSLYYVMKKADRSSLVKNYRKDECDLYRQRLFDWLCGANPFDACMVQGLGFNNPEYMKEWPGIDGGICNGITSSLKNERDIALCETEDPMHSWRWGEQWIPHAAWWLAALS